MRLSRGMWSRAALGSVAEAVAGRSGQSVVVEGWMTGVQRFKGVKFFHLWDGLSSARLQVVVPGEVGRAAKAAGAVHGAAVRVEGRLEDSPGRLQRLELVATTVEPQAPTRPTPIQPRTKYSPAFLRRYPHLRAKTASFAALLRVRSRFLAAAHAFFHRSDFLNITTPAITTNDCEGGGETFRVTSRKKPGREALEGVEAVEEEESLSPEEQEAVAKEAAGERDPSEFFGQPTFLTTSGQLHLEVMAGALKKVYTLSPAFRAEATIRRFHMAEFLMLEAEWAFLESYEPLLDLVEDFLRKTSGELLESCNEELATLDAYHHGRSEEGHLAAFREKLLRPFPRITFDEARRLLSRRSGLRFPVEEDLKKEHEWALVEEVGEGGPVWVTEFPAEAKPFYAARSECGRWARAFDLLVPVVGELCSGSLRERDFAALHQRMAGLGVAEELAWYSELRLAGYAPTGGFGVGVDRCLQTLLGVRNSKDCLPFPLSYQQAPLPNQPLLYPTPAND